MNKIKQHSRRTLLKKTALTLALTFGMGAGLGCRNQGSLMKLITPGFWLLFFSISCLFFRNV